MEAAAELGEKRAGCRIEGRPCHVQDRSVAIQTA